MKCTGGIGGIALVMCAVLSGSLNSGDRIRGNYNTENVEDRVIRNKWITQLLLFALPNLSIALIIYFALK